MSTTLGRGQKLEAPLHEALRVTVQGFETTTTPWDLGRRIDVAAAVDRELERENEPNLAVRLEQAGVGTAPPWPAMQSAHDLAAGPANWLTTVRPPAAEG